MSTFNDRKWRREQMSEGVSPKVGATRLIDKLVQSKLLDKKNQKKAIDLLTYLMARGIHEGKLNEAKEYKIGDTVKLKTGEAAKIIGVVKGPRPQYNTYHVSSKGKKFDIGSTDISEGKLNEGVKEDMLKAIPDSYNYDKLAKDVAEIIKEEYGSHNIKPFVKSIVKYLK